jgi:hypothetical protein
VYAGKTSYTTVVVKWVNTGALNVLLKSWRGFKPLPSRCPIKEALFCLFQPSCQSSFTIFVQDPRLQSGNLVPMAGPPPTRWTRLVPIFAFVPDPFCRFKSLLNKSNGTSTCVQHTTAVKDKILEPSRPDRHTKKRSGPRNC